MKELTNSQKLEVVKAKVKELGLTSYFIAQRTELGEKGIKNILDGKVKRPHSNTVNTLFSFLEKYQEQEDRKNTVFEEERTGYGQKEPLTAQGLIAAEVLEHLEPVLRRIKNTQEHASSTIISNAMDLQEIRESLEDLSTRMKDMNDQLEKMRKIMTSEK